MAKFTSTALFPFLLVTLLAAATVELGYYCLERFVFDPVATAAGVLRKEKTVALPGQQVEQVLPQAQTLDYSVITRRNLFGTPPSSATAEPVQAEEELEATTLDIVLMGTVDTDGDDGRAIILKKSDRSQEIYQVGDMVEGASVKEIQRGRVILSVDGRNELLDISEARQYAARSAPAASRTAALRRTPVVRPQATVPQDAPRVVRPLRRIVRPQAAIAADQAERENLELIEDNSQPPEDDTDITNEETADTEPGVAEETAETDAEDAAEGEQAEEEPDNEEEAVQ